MVHVEFLSNKSTSITGQITGQIEFRNASKPDELLNKVRHTAKNTEDKNEATC